MADQTSIEWTDATWNPVRGCTRVSEGCRNCYAEVMAARFSDPGQWGHGLAQRVPLPGGGIDHRWTGQVHLVDDMLDLPLRWRKPRRIFVNSTSDLFHEGLPDDAIDQVFAVMALAPQHTFQVLTKRPERARAYLTAHDCSKPGDSITNAAFGLNGRARGYRGSGGSASWPLPNVWIGTSVEDQPTADARIPQLLATPAAVRFVSAEPLLGPVDMLKCPTHGDAGGAWDWLRGTRYWHSGQVATPGLDWVICGGESGPGARPMHPDWARSLRDQCQAAGVPFFFKQWGEWVPWEMRAAPMWQAQDGRWEDGNILFPPDMDNDPRWDDGLNHYEPGVTDHSAFERVGKKAAGRLLDGRTWDEFPGTPHA